MSHIYHIECPVCKDGPDYEKPSVNHHYHILVEAIQAYPLAYFAQSVGWSNADICFNSMGHHFDYIGEHYQCSDRLLVVSEYYDPSRHLEPDGYHLFQVKTINLHSPQAILAKAILLGDEVAVKALVDLMLDSRVFQDLNRKWFLNSRNIQTSPFGAITADIRLVSPSMVNDSQVANESAIVGEPDDGN